MHLAPVETSELDLHYEVTPMEQIQTVCASRRWLIRSSMALTFAVTIRRATAGIDIQPLAKASGFPQMPTGGTGVTPCGSYAPPATIPTFGRIASDQEPGESLEISGTIYLADGKTPAADIVVFAYHTDARGYYNRPNSPFNPRLHGWVKSDTQGRYGLRTIKPAPYPELSTPAHIHVSLFSRDIPEYWIDDYWFSGDPLITPAQRALLTGRGGGGETLTLTRDQDGVLQGKRDFVLERTRVSGNCKLL
jgi:protocatechuate 3,4-dioxygenase beta subunit